MALLHLQAPALKHKLLLLMHRVALGSVSRGMRQKGSHEACWQASSGAERAACLHTGPEHSRKKYRNRQSISRLPLSSGSSCADNKPCKSPCSTEAFFSPSPALAEVPCKTQDLWQGCLPCPSMGKYPKAVQPPEHPGRPPALGRQLGAAGAVSCLIVPLELCG